MQIDLHAHILFDIDGDDGSRSKEMSLDMLRMAAASGVKEIFATPHVNRRGVVPRWEDIKARTQTLQESAVQEDIPIRIHAGAEVELNYSTLRFLPKGGRAYCLNESPYILVELTEQSEPDQTESMLFELMLRGYQPILAHPERYARIMHHPERVLDWMQRGILTQCNIGSFAGDFGEACQQRAEALLQNRMICFLGSDAHRTDWRSPETKHARKALAKRDGGEALLQEAADNAQALLAGGMIYPDLPDNWQKEKKGFWGRLFGR